MGTAENPLKLKLDTEEFFKTTKIPFKPKDAAPFLTMFHFVQPSTKCSKDRMPAQVNFGQRLQRPSKHHVAGSPVSEMV